MTGVELESGEVFQANDGVVLATGGFEWDKALADSMLASRLYDVFAALEHRRRPADGPADRRADPRHPREAWWACPSPATPATDQPIGTLLRFERQGPGSLMVNRHGRRFANESQNYNDLARSLQSWDSPRNQTLSTPAHVIVDHAYLEVRHPGPSRWPAAWLSDRGGNAGGTRGKDQCSRGEPRRNGSAVQ